MFDGKGKGLGSVLRGKSVLRRKSDVNGGEGDGLGARKKSEVGVKVGEGSNGTGSGAAVIQEETSVRKLPVDGNANGNSNPTINTSKTTDMSRGKSIQNTGKKSQSEGNGKASKTGLLRGMSVRNSNRYSNGNGTVVKSETDPTREVEPELKAKRRRSWAFWRDDGKVK